MKKEITKRSKKTFYPDILNAISGQKKDILSNPVVINGLSQAEYSLISLSVFDFEIASKKPIKFISDEDLKNEIQQTLKFILKNIGIKNISVDDFSFYGTNLFKYLRLFYSEFSYKEIETAFEFLHAGYLDEWLPKNSENMPDKSHYQVFSGEYISKVLNAFKKFKNKTWTKAYRLMPEPVKQVTDEEKLTYRKAFLNDIHLKFEAYKKGQEFEFMASSKVVNEFRKAGFIEENFQTTHEDMELAMAKIAYDKTKTSMQKNSFNVNATANFLANHRKIREVFDRLIKEGKKIKDVLSL